MREHIWLKKKKIIPVGGDEGARNGTKMKEVSFFECKRCGLQVLRKGATPHKDCDESLALLVIRDDIHF